MSQTKKYLMFISYIGSGFRGSQIQILKESNVTLATVQDVVEKGLKSVFQLKGERPILSYMASRTDTGVHALKAALYVNLPVFRYDFIQPNLLVQHLNSHFSKSQPVRVLECHLVPDSFKFSKVKKEKTYLYRVGFLKEEFFKERYKKIMPIVEVDRTYLMSLGKTYSPFDLKKAQDAASLFEGIKDFGAVTGKPIKNIRPTICNIISFKVQESQPLFLLDPLAQRFCFYQFLCVGDRFLFHMVRRMVSLTIGVGQGHINLEDIQKLFDEPYPSSWPKRGITQVPGCGLYLADIRLDLEDFLQKEELSWKTTDEVYLKNGSEEIV